MLQRVYCREVMKLELTNKQMEADDAQKEKNH